MPFWWGMGLACCLKCFNGSTINYHPPPSLGPGKCDRVWAQINNNIEKLFYLHDCLYGYEGVVWYKVTFRRDHDNRPKSILSP